MPSVLERIRQSCQHLEINGPNTVVFVLPDGAHGRSAPMRRNCARLSLAVTRTATWSSARPRCAASTWSSRIVTMRTRNLSGRTRNGRDRQSAGGATMAAITPRRASERTKWPAVAMARAAHAPEAVARHHFIGAGRERQSQWARATRSSPPMCATRTRSIFPGRSSGMPRRAFAAARAWRPAPSARSSRACSAGARR